MLVMGERKNPCKLGFCTPSIRKLKKNINFSFWQYNLFALIFTEKNKIIIDANSLHVNASVPYLVWSRLKSAKKRTP